MNLPESFRPGKNLDKETKALMKKKITRRKSLISIVKQKIEQKLEQRVINKRIEENVPSSDKEAIRLINLYAECIISAKKGTVVCGRNLPPSTPCPVGQPTYSSDFLMMKNFLEKHPDYKTRSAKKIRTFYGFENF